MRESEVPLVHAHFIRTTTFLLRIFSPRQGFTNRFWSGYQRWYPARRAGTTGTLRRRQVPTRLNRNAPRVRRANKSVLFSDRPRVFFVVEYSLSFSVVVFATLCSDVRARALKSPVSLSVI